MSLDDLLNFEILFYSPDGVVSPVFDAIKEIAKKDRQAGMVCVDKIQGLPVIFYHHTKGGSKEIKHFKDGILSYYELRIRYKNNAYRFFFTVERPNLIVFYGFIKKTQKTETKDKNKARKYIEDYTVNKRTVKPKFK